MNDSQQAIATWLGTLGRGGIITQSIEDAGVAVAAYVVGEDRLSELREHMSGQADETIHREQVAALRVCIAAAHADRVVHEEELAMLQELVRASRLDIATGDQLLQQVREPPDIENVAKDIAHPVLRELLLALTWELVLVDERVNDDESSFYHHLADLLSVDRARAAEIQSLVAAQLDG